MSEIPASHADRRTSQGAATRFCESRSCRLSGSRRADTLSNSEAVAHAAIELPATKPSAAVAEIAHEAGLGRVTLYVHCTSRPELLEVAVVVRVITDCEVTLREVDLDGNSLSVLDNRFRMCWRLVDRSRAVIAAAQDELAPATVRDPCGAPAGRAEALVARCHDEGVFGNAVPIAWRVSFIHQLLHGRAIEVSQVRLVQSEASELVVRSVQAFLYRSA